MYKMHGDDLLRYRHLILTAFVPGYNLTSSDRAWLVALPVALTKTE